MNVEDRELACINAARVIRLRSALDNLVVEKPKFAWPKMEDWLREMKKEAKEVLDDTVVNVKPELPKVKSLEHLWHMHGLAGARCDFDEELQLLEYWVEVLYGKGEWQKIKLKERLAEIFERQALMRSAIRRGGGHVMYASGIDTVLGLTEELLPHYDSVQGAQ